jgi:exonuclease III
MSEINNKENPFSFLSEDKQDVDLSFVDENVESVLAELDQEAAEENKEDVVTLPESKAEKTTVESVENNVVGTSTKTTKTAKNPKLTTVKKEGKPEKVAIHSSKNASWNGVGSVYRGYNIVLPEHAEKWLTRNHIRPATPEEVAKEFGL